MGQGKEHPEVELSKGEQDVKLVTLKERLLGGNPTIGNFYLFKLVPIKKLSSFSAL